MPSMYRNDTVHSTLPGDSVDDSPGTSLEVVTASTREPSSEVSETSRIDPRDYYDDIDVFCVLGEEFERELRDVLKSGRGGETGLSASLVDEFEDFYRDALFVVGHPDGRSPRHNGDTSESNSDQTFLKIPTASIAPERSALLSSLIDYGLRLKEAAVTESLRPYRDIFSSYRKPYSDCTPKSIDRDHPLWEHAIDAFTTDRQLQADLAGRVQVTEELESLLSEDLVQLPEYSAALQQVSDMPEGEEQTLARNALMAWASTLEQAKKDTKEGLTDGTSVKDRFARANSSAWSLGELSGAVRSWVEAGSRQRWPARG